MYKSSESRQTHRSHTTLDELIVSEPTVIVRFWNVSVGPWFYRHLIEDGVVKHVHEYLRI